MFISIMHNNNYYFNRKRETDYGNSNKNMRKSSENKQLKYPWPYMIINYIFKPINWNWHMVTVIKSSKSSENASIFKTLFKNVFFGELKTKMLIFGDDLIILYEIWKIYKK